MTEFHQISFENVAEAAGLVAALSRQLASPRPDLRGLTPIDVAVLRRGQGADVYVSTAALTATARAFALPPNVSTVEQVPAGAVWILREGETRPLGTSDVLNQLV